MTEVRPSPYIGAGSREAAAADRRMRRRRSSSLLAAALFIVLCSLMLSALARACRIAHARNTATARAAAPSAAHLARLRTPRCSLPQPHCPALSTSARFFSAYTQQTASVQRALDDPSGRGQIHSSAAASPRLAAVHPVMSHSSLAEYESAMKRVPGQSSVKPRSSPEDKREYAVITLDNGLRAVLISDPITDKAAASLDVNIGHFSDPDELPGLAHFCEHMLFLGTEQFPDENSYAAFLSAHGGSSNAYTSTESTNYHFDVQWAHLSETLDRFSAFFKCPLFAPACVDRELNAVHNENSKNLQSDQWRLFQLLKATSNPKHPMHKFGTGNLATLRDGPKAKGIDVRDELLAFHRRYYSPRIMSLAVIGRESIGQLQEWVQNKFGPIKAAEQSANARPVLGSDAMTSEQLGRLIHVVPVKDLRSLSMLWSIDSSVHHLYGSKPLELLSHCIGHESTGSVLSYLKSRHWANGLSAGMKISATSFAMFTVTVDLTEAGLEHVNEVAEAVQSYIRHVVQRSLAEQPERWEREVYAEVKAVNEMGFTFKSKESPQSLVSHLASALQTYPPEHLLDGAYQLRSFEQGLLRYFADLLADPTKMRVHLVAQAVKPKLEAQGKTMEKERWYGTEFVNQPLSADADLAARLANPARIEALALPPFNSFIADQFALKNPQHSEAEIEAKKEYAPTRIEIDSLVDAEENKADFIPLTAHPLSQVYWKADKTYHLPKANILLRFLTPLAYSEPRNVMLASLFAQILQDALNEFAYNAEQAGLSYNLYSTQQGLSLSIGGYDQKQSTLLFAILEMMRSVRATAKASDFNRLREQMKRGLQNFVKENPYNHAVFDEVLTLESTLWTHAEKLAVIDQLTPEQLDAFSEQLLSAAEIELFVHGNVVESDVRSIALAVQRTLNFRPLFASQLPRSRVVQLSPSYSYLRQRTGLNPDDANSASLSLYQLGENSVELHTIANLFAHIIKEPLYNQLRTQEQLGYLVWSNLVSIKGVLHFRVLLQSSAASADYLNYRVEAFLSWWRSVDLPQKIAEDPAFFATHVAAVISKLTEKDKTLGAESQRLWTEITLKRFQFDRVEREVAALKALDVTHLLRFIDQFIIVTPASDVQSQRRKLNIQYFGKGKTIPDPVLRETEERVAFANLPVPAEEKAVDADAAASSVAAPAAAAAVAADADASASPPPLSAKEVSRPPVPLDPREIVMLDDFNAFKSSMPLYPSLQ